MSCQRVCLLAYATGGKSLQNAFSRVSTCMTNHQGLYKASNVCIGFLCPCSGSFLITKVIRVVKHVHISGRWPASRQHRLGRNVQGDMPKVVGRQRIKRARGARAKILYTYMCDPIFCALGWQFADPPIDYQPQKSVGCETNQIVAQSNHFMGVGS